MKGRIYPTKYGWQVRFGATICRHFPQNNLIGAERCLNYLRHQVDEGIFDPRDHQVKRNPLGLKKLGDKWLQLKHKQVKPKSYANLARYMKYAYKYFGKSTNIKILQYGQIEDFLFSLSLSDKSRFNAKSCLHDFLKWVSRRERIPMPDLPNITFELEWRNVVSIEVQQGILNKLREISYSINPKIFLGVRFLATYISTRPGELLSIRERQIDLSMGAIVIPHPKEKRPKVTYLLGEDIDIIKSMPRGLPDMYFFRHPPGIRGAKAGQKFGPNYLWVWWKRACAELGIENVDLYGGTRHSTTTALGRICTPEEVRDALGDVSKSMERYFQHRQARALRVTQKIRELRGDVVDFGKTHSKINP